MKAIIKTHIQQKHTHNQLSEIWHVFTMWAICGAMIISFKQNLKRKLCAFTGQESTQRNVQPCGHCDHCEQFVSLGMDHRYLRQIRKQ